MYNLILCLYIISLIEIKIFFLFGFWPTLICAQALLLALHLGVNLGVTGVAIWGAGIEPGLAMSKGTLSLSVPTVQFQCNFGLLNIHIDLSYNMFIDTHALW